VKIISYRGNAEDILEPAARLGWEYVEDDYLDSDGMIDWDRVLDKASAYLKKLGYIIEYN
jgi:hypothetical protein